MPRPGLVGNLFSLIKQRGALLAKGRLLGVQFDTLFTDGLYERVGKVALSAADRLAAGLSSKGYTFYAPPKTNQIFVIVDDSVVDRLRSQATFSLWEHLDDRRPSPSGNTSTTAAAPSASSPTGPLRRPMSMRCSRCFDRSSRCFSPKKTTKSH